MIKIIPIKKIRNLKLPCYRTEEEDQAKYSKDPPALGNWGEIFIILVLDVPFCAQTRHG
jgi:hypothetical protein